MTAFARFENLLLVAIGALLGAQPALAQRGTEVTVEVGECLKIEAPTERLACFERRVDEARDEDAAPATSPARGAVTPPAAAATPSVRTAPAEVTQRAPAVRAPSPADDDSFGRRSSSRREEREARDLEQRTELVATVVSVRETIPNSYTITLDNGQVWRQNRPEYYPLQPGHEVRIYPGKIGDSYRLTAPFLRGWIQVERVR